MKNNNIILQRELDSTIATTEVAQDFANELKEGDAVALKGELGSGKTFFVREVAKELDYDELVTSPTFVILNVYRAQIPIYHFDLYRLEQAEELENVGFVEFLNRDGIVFVEWPEIAKDYFPPKYYTVELTIIKENKRKIVIKKLIGSDSCLN